MLTSILKHPHSVKVKSQNSYRNDPFRQKIQLLMLDQMSLHHDQPLKTKNQNQTQLPMIYRTENLLTHKQSFSPFGRNRHDKENAKLSMPKLAMVNQSLQRDRKCQKGRERMATDEREKASEGMRVYHNFINQKRNKKKTHMNKIIDKVISQNIEPWNPEYPIKQSNKYRQIDKTSILSQKINFNQLMGWQRDLQQSTTFRQYNC